MIKVTAIRLIILVAFISSGTGCREISVPKPLGYFRIDLPQKEYQRFSEEEGKEYGLPVSFEYPSYGHLTFGKDGLKEPGWFNIEFPSYKASIYFTYKTIHNDFEELMEQTYKMNIKNHISKADAINEEAINDSGDKIYGIIYDLKGNTATAVQFYVTDSVKHYLRGSLYFSAEPDADSLAPVIDFFRGDIVHFIETLKWRN